MQKIIIKQFQAIAEVEIELSNMLILIGEQAGGKSTISKLIYFFKSLPQDSTIQFFKTALQLKSKNFFNFNLEAYVVMQSTVYPRKRASRDAIFVKFLEDFGVELFKKTQNLFDIPLGWLTLVGYKPPSVTPCGRVNSAKPSLRIHARNNCRLILQFQRTNGVDWVWPSTRPNSFYSKFNRGVHEPKHAPGVKLL